MTKTLKKIEGVYHAPIHARGRTKWISTGANNKAEAQKVLTESGVEKLNVLAKAGRLTSKAIGQALTGRNLTLLKALEKYCELKKPSIAPKTLANHTKVIFHWLKEMGLESRPPSFVTPDHISRWVNDPKSPRKRTTRAAILSGLRSFFAFCSEHGWTVSNPARLVELNYKAMSHAQKETAPKEPFTDAEVKLLIGKLRMDWERGQKGKNELFRDPMDVMFWLFAVIAGRDTGLRISDIAQMGWRSFEKDGKLIVWTEKTNKRVELPISKELQDLVSEIPVNDPDYLFPKQRTLTLDLSKRAGLSIYFARLCERLGIKGKSFHSLRHYKATHEFSKMDKQTLAARLAEVLTMEQIASLLGHASVKTTKGYLH